MTVRDTKTEDLIAAAIRHFRTLHPAHQAELIDAEPHKRHHEKPLTNPNPCLEVVLDRPAEPCTIGTKEPGERAYEIMNLTDRRATVPAGWWRSLGTETKRRWAAVEAGLSGADRVVELETQLEVARNALYDLTKELVRPTTVVRDNEEYDADEVLDLLETQAHRFRIQASGSSGVWLHTWVPRAAAQVIRRLMDRLAPDPAYKTPSETDALKLEAAEFHGFTPVDDNATTYRATAQQVINLMNVARKQGLDDAITTLQEKANG